MSKIRRAGELMLAGRRFRVELTNAQARLAQQTADACRAVYNTGLEQRREYRRRGAWMNYGQQAHQLVEAKAERPWLTEVPGHCLQQALRDLDEACRRHGTFKVRWRSARKWVPSFRFPEGSKMVVERLNRGKSRVKLPKLGWVKFRASRSLDGETIRSATLTREGRHWYVSLLVDDGAAAPSAHVAPDTAVGVDRGVVVAVATSAGDLLDQVFTTAAENAVLCGCNAHFPAPPSARPTATTRANGTRGCGLKRRAGGGISASRPPGNWQRKTLWWCWKNYRRKT